ncbi:MAG TPA: MFS transporter [Candidatus Dormibacteraeota bacterium]|nr:MFS transporter [Candidatus Dormibacteraeota bacterium]
MNPSSFQSDPKLEKRALNWSYVLVGVADGTLLPFVPLFLLKQGMSAPLIGAVLAAAALASLAAGMSWAYLADRRLRAERIIPVATIAAALTALLLAVTNGAVLLTAVIVVLWLARAPFMLLDPIALRRLINSRRTDYARIRLRMSAGWAASVTVIGGVYQLLSLRLMPFVYAPLTLLFGFWVWRAVKPAPSAEKTAAPVASGPRRLGKLPLALLGFLASTFLLGVSLAATQNFLVLQISALGGGAFLVGAAAAFQAVAEIPTMGYTHVLTRYVSHRTLFALGCGIYLVTFIAWAFVTSAFVAAALKLAVGVGFALTYVASVMLADELSPVRLRATGQALFKSVAFGLAPIAGTFAGGLVYGTLGARAMFLGSTVLVAGAGLVAVLALPSPARRTVEEPGPTAPEPSPVIP